MPAVVKSLPSCTRCSFSRIVSTEIHLCLKVTDQITVLAGMEEAHSRHTSPRIGARKSPLPSEKFPEPLIPKHPIATPDSPSREVRKPYSPTLFFIHLSVGLRKIFLGLGKGP